MGVYTSARSIRDYLLTRDKNGVGEPWWLDYVGNKKFCIAGTDPANQNMLTYEEVAVARAMEFVTRKAELGSSLHKKALLLHIEGRLGI